MNDLKMHTFKNYCIKTEYFKKRVTVTSPKRHKGFASEVPKSGKIRHSSQTNFLINVTSPNVKINIRH